MVRVATTLLGVLFVACGGKLTSEVDGSPGADDGGTVVDAESLPEAGPPLPVYCNPQVGAVDSPVVDDSGLNPLGGQQCTPPFVDCAYVYNPMSTTSTEPAHEWTCCTPGGASCIFW